MKNQKKSDESRRLRHAPRLTAICRAMAVAFIMMLAAGAIPAQAAVKVPKSITVYQNSAVDLFNTYTLTIKDPKGNVRLNPKSVKSSAYGINIFEVYNYKSKTRSYSTENNSTYSYSAIVLTMALPDSSSDITFKIGSKSYAVNVIYKAYTNPLETFKVSGVSNGENIAAQFDVLQGSSLSVKKTTKNAKIRLKAKAGWGITSVKFSRDLHDSGYPKTRVCRYSKPQTGTVTIPVGTLKKRGSYSMEIKMKNLSDKGTITIPCYIN